MNLFNIILFILAAYVHTIRCTQRLVENTIMAHRGVWGYFPEHSIHGFELAYYMGAHYLETDINMTKDCQLIIHHDSYLDDVTDVNEHVDFDARRRSDVVDGLPVSNKLFVSDFTYEEIQKLFLKQRNPMRPQLYNKEYKVVLLESLIQMVISNNKVYNRTTGIYIEPKSIDYYKRITGINLNEKVAELLSHYKLVDYERTEYNLCPIVIQSFEIETLKFFKSAANLPQVALMRWREFYNLKELAEVAHGFGPDIDFVLYERIDDHLSANGTVYESEAMFRSNVTVKPFKEPVEDLGRRILKQTDNKFVEFAKMLGKHVQIWNINNDAPKFTRDPVIEYAKMASLGVSAFFSDFCDTALFSVKHHKKLIQLNSVINKEDF